MYETLLGKCETAEAAVSALRREAYKLSKEQKALTESLSPIPIDMILYCPHCHTQHIDAPEPEKEWTNPAHKSHLCHNCQAIFRPADVPTNGVAAIKTAGERDRMPVNPTKENVAATICDYCDLAIFQRQSGVGRMWIHEKSELEACAREGVVTYATPRKTARPVTLQELTDLLKIEIACRKAGMANDSRLSVTENVIAFTERRDERYRQLLVEQQVSIAKIQNACRNIGMASDAGLSVVDYIVDFIGMVGRQFDIRGAVREKATDLLKIEKVCRESGMPDNFTGNAEGIIRFVQTLVASEERWRDQFDEVISDLQQLKKECEAAGMDAVAGAKITDAVSLFVNGLVAERKARDIEAGNLRRLIGRIHTNIDDYETSCKNP